MIKMIPLALLFIVLVSGCAGNQEILESSVKPETPLGEGKADFWLDEETGTVHRFEIVDGVEKVVSITKYREGKPLEVMKILSSDKKDGKFHWSYFVPSTLYAVELTALVIGENEISVEWKNRSAEGEEDSGTDRLLRCNEYGAGPGTEIEDAEETDLPDDFSSFENID